MMYKLAEGPGSRQGAFCEREGLYLGPVALIERRDGGVWLRAEDEIMALLYAAYGSVPEPKAFGVKMREVGIALEEEDLSRAMIAALQLAIAEIPDGGIARLIQTDSLSKHSFNALQPRDWHGRWGGDSSAGLLPVKGNGPPSRRSSSGGRLWQRFPNADFRNRLAIAEGSAASPIPAMAKYGN